MKQIRFNNPPHTLWGNTLYGFTIEDEGFDSIALSKRIRQQHGQFSLDTINGMIQDLETGNYSIIDNLDIIWIY